VQANIEDFARSEKKVSIISDLSLKKKTIEAKHATAEVQTSDRFKIEPIKKQESPKVEVADSESSHYREKTKTISTLHEFSNPMS